MSPSSFRKSLCLAFLFLIAVGVLNAQWAPLVSDPDAAQRVAWWREARFGMFMHWGVYSIPGRGEWVQWAEQIPNDQYAQLADQFHPEHFDADAWASIAKAGGMKYMVFTQRFERTVDQDNTVRFHNLVMQLERAHWRHTLAGCKTIIHQHLDMTLTLMIAGHRIGHYSAEGKLLTPLSKKQIKAVEKTLRGKVHKQTFPLNLQIPHTTRASHFPTASTATNL